jgi:hypothetical protein
MRKQSAVWIFFVAICAAASAFPLPIPAANPTAPVASVVCSDAVIRGKTGSSEIVITTTSRAAGAIHSLKWGTSTDGNMKEFIDSTDHGRQLQSAAAFDVDKDHGPETFNPTEAGSRDDGDGEKSSCKLLRLRADGSLLETTTQMAFWLAPGEKSEGQLARNEKVLSDCVLSKRVHIGHKGLPHAIEYEVTFNLPVGEKHFTAQFEALTGYMPAEFSRFWIFNIEKGVLEELSDGPGEQSRPVVFSTADDAYAMGVYSPDQPSRGWEQVGCGRFRFKEEKVNKWNCAFRVANFNGLSGDYHFQMFVAVGTLDDVKTTLKALVSEFKHP